MSKEVTKKLVVEVKELSIEKDQHVSDLLRFLTEHLSQIEIERTGNELTIELPSQMSKRAIRLRLKKFLYQKKLDDKFRPISYKTAEKNGYKIKEKKIIELSYY